MNTETKITGREEAIAKLDEWKRQAEAVADALNELERFRKASDDLGYDDGDLVGNISRYKIYAEGELSQLRNGSKKLQAYTLKLQSLLKPEQFLPIATEMTLKPLNEPDPSKAKKSKTIEFIQTDARADLLARLQKAEQQLKEAVDLLRVSKCPNCDGSGSYPVEGPHGEAQECRCQFCFELNACLASQKDDK